MAVLGTASTFLAQRARGACGVLIPFSESPPTELAYDSSRDWLVDLL